MVKDKLPKYIKWLMDECDYPHEDHDKHLIQTHISYVVLVGGYVYKWKKSVELGFLDFSTLEKREYFCQQELILNQRLCPEIYLTVVCLTRTPTGFELNGGGEVVEYGVKMVRMPEQSMMNNMIASGEVRKTHIDKIVGTLVPFYEKASAGGTINTYGLVETVSKNVMENFHQTERFVESGRITRTLFQRVKSYAMRYLENEQIFKQRIASRKIHDCHGDLHSSNICLAEKVYVFDCIEFNDRLRYSDIVADIAFLAMDLDFHGLENLSTYFIETFFLESHDEEMNDHLLFYKCYRAAVRAKVSLLLSVDTGVEKAERHKNETLGVRYFSLAEKYSEQAGIA